MLDSGANMKLDPITKFRSIVQRIKVEDPAPPCTFAVDFDWNNVRWWKSQGVFNDCDRYAVVSRHVSELHQIIYHTVCFPGKILGGSCADVTLCCPHVVPLASIELLLHQADQEWRYLLMKICRWNCLANVFHWWRTAKDTHFWFQ